MLTRALAFIAAHPRWTALVAGGVSATGFAPLDLWPLTLIALALLLWLLERAETGRSAFLLGWLWGVGHFAIGLNWIATAFTFQAAMPAWLGWIAVVLLSLYLAVFPGLAALGAWWGNQLLTRKSLHPGESRDPSPVTGASTDLEMGPGLRQGDEVIETERASTLPLLLLFAAAWIVTEWLRSWVFTGFAWNPLGATTLDLALLRLAPVIGTYGVSALMILVAGGLMLAMHAAAQRSARTPAIILLGLGIPMLFAAAEFVFARTPSVPTGSLVTIVQPNNAQGDKYDPAEQAANYARLVRQSQRAPDAPPRLLLWPEAAIPDYLVDGYPLDWYAEPASFTRTRLASLLGPNDLLLTGAVHLETDRAGREVIGARNSVFVLDAERRVGPRYDKAHLVPYGEYLPMRAILEPLGLSRLVPGAVDFWPGPGPRTLDLSDREFGRVGIQICYEIIFSGQVVDRANRPDFIFNPSNDAWFGTWGPPQHLAQARLRAIEEGLPVVRSTPTGISAIIAPDGRIIQSLPMGTAGRIDARLPRADEPTLFARFGNILPLLLAAFLMLCGVAFALRRR